MFNVTIMINARKLLGDITRVNRVVNTLVIRDDGFTLNSIGAFPDIFPVFPENHFNPIHRFIINMILS